MRFLRIAVLLMLVAGFTAVAGSARTLDLGAPTGLHGFMLRADEPQATTFDRTPSFAWNPVPGATGYEFQLSTSSTFRDNGVIYADDTLTTPVAAPNVTLPWISGSPHSLYARARAVTQDTTSAWSASFGFDMAPPPAPAPMPSYPGLLRWTPVEGANGYQVWLIDAKKMEIVNSNVLDEREFYTFHQSAAWTGTVRWRVRALRDDFNVGTSRINKIPITMWGPWSPVYSSTNPGISGGPIKLIGTVSDVFSNGSASSPAQRLMPAFLWSGNQTSDGTAVELFRVMVFSDKQCLNPVLTGSVVGSQAYSPRPYGTLSMPTLPVSLQGARGIYLPDAGAHAKTTIDWSYDGQQLTLSEQADAATPTTTAPSAPGDTGASGSSGSGSSGASGSGGGAAVGGLAFSGDTGAPVDLWDTDWPGSGYYWTVIPVGAIQPGALTSFVRAPGAKATDTSIPVTTTAGFNVGDNITIGGEQVSITGIGDGTLGVTALKSGHLSGELISRQGGSVQYIDLELPQDICASGRVARFGKNSEPSLTSSGDLFATGLSPGGRLTSALHTASFYGAPLVSWTPALGAEAYQVQWSKTRYPFVPELSPGTSTKGFLTPGTSAVLPLGKQPGSWWYRVRGLDYSLPTGAQQMAWSDPANIVVTKPTFKLTTPLKKFKVIGKSK
ncbi:MAG TPA: hypothetical protein VGN27_05565 [Gaiellaceae bacterium]|nr:hypothetical protein [Gaiellaceae bacterium]